MKKTIYLWQLLGFIFTSVLGVILHFLFDWTSESVVVSLFSAVNESIWEHMKLIFFPMLFFSLIENWYISKDYKSFWCVKLMGILLGLCLIPVLYYTINGVFGKTADWVNIAIFFITAAVSFAAETWLFFHAQISGSAKRALLILGIIVIVFAFFTFFPPRVPLFKDPITGGYGIYSS